MVHGISLNSTSHVSLGYMNVSNSGGDGLFGTSVNNFALNGSTFTNNGNAVGEAGIDFGGLTGAASITNSTITTSHENNATISNLSGTLGLTVTGSTFSNNSTKTQSDDGLLIKAGGSATITALVQGNTFTANRGDHFQAAAENDTDMNITFKGNTLTGGHATALGQDIVINAGIYSGTTRYDIDGNTINGAILSAITTNLGVPSEGALSKVSSATTSSAPAASSAPAPSRRTASPWTHTARAPIRSS